MQLEGFVEVSEVLRSGVYALAKDGVIIYVGKSKSLYQRIYSHKHVAKRASQGKSIPDWLPIKGFTFDQVFVRVCHVDQLDALEAEMINLYKPKYNSKLKNNAAPPPPTTINIRGLQLNLNASPPAPKTEGPIRRL